MICAGQRTESLRTRRTELPTRREPAEEPGRYTSETTFGAARSLTSTTVIFVVPQPKKQPAPSSAQIGIATAAPVTAGWV